ncbi:MAG: CotH kinase family protein [Bacteroidaceae bacterium]|nr:CotH kinase family protein [Bacteroidaceae bacterium]
MRTRILLSLILLASFLGISAQDNYYVYLTDGSVLGYPKEYVKSVDKGGGAYTLTLESDSVISWTAAQVLDVSDSVPEYPQFTKFELDDKRNDQLYRDVEATISADGVAATVSGIGKYLTPLFEMDMAGAVAYVNGKEQESEVSRLRFANDVVYTLSLPGYQRLSMEKISDEVWSEPETGVSEIPLTEDMLSTNEPPASNEGFANLFDGNNSSIFHSRWESAGANVSQPAYISVELPRSISEFQFWYVGRDNKKYDINEWVIEASNDGYWWEEITTLGYDDGLPASRTGYEFTSPAINLGGEYRYLRFIASSVGHKNYLCLAELKLYEVTGITSEPELLHPAKYAYQMVPMGREVPVHINWLTDQATSVPCIYIDIENGEIVSSKEYYLNADITFEGNGVWDDYDFSETVKIKGRGNSSWGGAYSYYDSETGEYVYYDSPKNPYRLKFEESQKPFGMKKGKNWNLIPQAQSGSLMTNPVAHKIARMVGLQTANDVVPVELYINGEYRGSYFFTQKVGMANNSVDFDDELQAALFELDSYSEEGQFRSTSYGLPVNIKAPEFEYYYGYWLPTDETDLSYEGIKAEFNRFETAVYNNANYERFVDVDMLVRYMLVNDLVLNTELGHPKSTFLSREDMGYMTRRYVFGPAWDFDWAYGYESGRSYCVSGAERDLFSYVQNVGADFYSDILRSSEWVQYRYAKLWDEFMDKHLDELIDFVDDYYAYARSSFEHNATMWGDGDYYENNVANMKSWLRQRAEYIKNNLPSYAPDAKEPFTYGDLNGDGAVNAVDAEYMLSALFGAPEEDMLDYQADVDYDEEVSLSDFTWINLLIEDEQAKQARSRQRSAAQWGDDEEAANIYDIDIDDMAPVLPSEEAKSTPLRATAVEVAPTLEVNYTANGWEVAVSVTSDTPYIAYSMDFVLPEAFALLDGSASITLSSRTSQHVMTGRRIGQNTYRVIGYSPSNAKISDTEGVLFTLSLSETSALLAGNYSLNVENVRFVTANAFEETMQGCSLAFEVKEEQITESATIMTQTPCWPADIYDTHGRLVRRQATSLNGLSKGVYIVNKRKVVVE